MRILIILAHPDKSSFNHAIARTAVERLERNGHDISFHDLYAENFDPLLVADEIPKAAVLPAVLKDHCEDIRQAEGIVIIHPNWWGQPPAVLKGWIDRVIRPGVAYEFQEGDPGEGVPKGLLIAEVALVFNTSNTVPEREQHVFRDPLETIWRNCVFGLCGVRTFHRRTFSVVVTSTETERKQWLDEVKRNHRHVLSKKGDQWLKEKQKNRLELKLDQEKEPPSLVPSFTSMSEDDSRLSYFVFLFMKRERSRPSHSAYFFAYSSGEYFASQIVFLKVVEASISLRGELGPAFITAFWPSLECR